MRGLLAIALVALLSLQAIAKTDTPALADRLEKAIPARMMADGVQGVVVALIADGAPVWTKAFGLADPGTGRAMTEDALFRVELISKPVTAWGAMYLVEAGRLDLDRPITDCLHSWQPPEGTPRLTAHQVLTHTAGIGLGDFAARFAPDAPRPRLADHLAQDFRMIAVPGTGFAYSDTGYNLLELLIEDCSGEDFAGYMQRDILQPLGMRRASFDWTGTEMPVGHDLRGRPVAPYVYPGRGSGGLFATTEDVARFAAAGMAGAQQDVLSPHGIAALHRPYVAVTGLFGIVADGYGLGHFTETLHDGRAALWHGGQGYGWMSHMHLVPESGDGIVILSNTQRAWPLFAMILRDWSGSLGVAPVGMARVLWAETGARIAMVLLLLLTVLALWRAIAGRPWQRTLRIGAAVVGGTLILWPIWAGMQDYLFLFSILPGLWPLLAAVSALAGLSLCAVAVFPKRRT